jgi:hypothetical protein
MHRPLSVGTYRLDRRPDSFADGGAPFNLVLDDLVVLRATGAASARFPPATASPPKSSHSCSTFVLPRESMASFADGLHASSATDAATLQWAVTALFYSALHVLRAYLLARHGERVTAHDEMHALLAKYPELNRTKAPYDLLKQESHAARYYLSEKFTWTDYDFLRKECSRVLNTWQPKVTALLGGVIGS